jgi:hypothetical protein
MLFDQMFRNIATQPGGPPSFLTGDQTAYSPQTPQSVTGPANPADYGMQQPQQQQGFGMPPGGQYMPQLDGQMGFGMPPQGYAQQPQQGFGMPAGGYNNFEHQATQIQSNIGYMTQPGNQQVGGPINPNSQLQSNF